MEDPTLEVMARTLAKLTLTEMILIPVTIGSFFVRLNRFRWLMTVVRAGLIVGVVLVGLPLLGALLMFQGL